MILRDRVLSNIILCGVELAFSASFTPSIIEGWQPFYNSIFEDHDFQKVYSSVATINFSQESKLSKAGYSYQQKVVFQFPISDGLRSERVALLEKIKYVKLKQNNGLDIVIGRNDFNQNAFPIIKTETDHQICQVSIESEAIAPVGYTPNINAYGLPVFIPLSF